MAQNLPARGKPSDMADFPSETINPPGRTKAAQQAVPEGTINPPGRGATLKPGFRLIPETTINPTRSATGAATQPTNPSNPAYEHLQEGTINPPGKEAERQPAAGTLQGHALNPPRGAVRSSQARSPIPEGTLNATRGGRPPSKATQHSTIPEGTINAQTSVGSTEAALASIQPSMMKQPVTGKTRLSGPHASLSIPSETINPRSHPMPRVAATPQENAPAWSPPAVTSGVIPSETINPRADAVVHLQVEKPRAGAPPPPACTMIAEDVLHTPHVPTPSDRVAGPGREGIALPATVAEEGSQQASAEEALSEAAEYGGHGPVLPLVVRGGGVTTGGQVQGATNSKAWPLDAPPQRGLPEYGHGAGVGDAGWSVPHGALTGGGQLADAMMPPRQFSVKAPSVADSTATGPWGDAHVDQMAAPQQLDGTASGYTGSGRGTEIGGNVGGMLQGGGLGQGDHLAYNAGRQGSFGGREGSGQYGAGLHGTAALQPTGGGHFDGYGDTAPPYGGAVSAGGAQGNLASGPTGASSHHSGGNGTMPGGVPPEHVAGTHPALEVTYPPHQNAMPPPMGAGSQQGSQYGQSPSQYGGGPAGARAPHYGPAGSHHGGGAQNIAAQQLAGSYHVGPQLGQHPQGDGGYQSFGHGGKPGPQGTAAAAQIPEKSGASFWSKMKSALCCGKVCLAVYHLPVRSSSARQLHGQQEW
jgi:hypothetical protein